MARATTLHSTAIAPIVAYLLSLSPGGGVDHRPANLTCIAEQVNSTILINNAFPTISFSRPLVMKQNSSDTSRIYVAEKGGTIQLILNGVKQPSPFLDISHKVSSGGEQGLLGLAFHPEYSTNRKFYVSYTDRNGDSVIAGYSRQAGDQNIADPASEITVLSLDQPYGNHNGGNLEFGQDGYLYIGFGDGGSGGDPLNHGQDLSTWHGSMLRIDVDSAQPYTIPATNPFAGQTCNQSSRTGTCPETYAYGLRNPWRWSFDTLSGDLWLGDVGQNHWEEVNRVASGANLGWRCVEGRESYNPSGCDGVTTVPPILDYAHSNGRCSITGGYVYRGSGIPELYGYYIYGDYCTGEIWGLSTSDLPQEAPILLATSPANISSFAEDSNGELYVLQSNGVIGKIERNPDGGGPDPVPMLLSQTGCVAPDNPTQPSSGMIPYAIHAPFWSDGLIKHRWLALPNKARIYNTSEEWYFPPGTVLIKQFSINGKLIETRHLKRHTNGIWAGYTYQWNTAQTEAHRLQNGKTVTIDTGGGTQDWVFPSETECMVCHTAAAGYALGPEPAQLNRDFTYPSTGRTDNQLNTASAIGLLTNRLGASPINLPRLTNPYDAQAPLEPRARAWLHTNCAGCHQDGGNTNSAMDLRSSRLLSETRSCNITSSSTGVGWPTTLLTPGNASASLLHFRANSRDAVIQMPPIGSTVVDTEGLALLGEWINSISTCTP